METRLKKIRVSAVVLGFLLLLAAQDVFSCDPGRPDPWFTTRLSFDEATVPSGIEIVQGDHSVYEPYALINKNSEPFYLVRENPWKKSFPNSELPDEYEPLYKITSSEVYFWGQRDSRDPAGWKPNSGGINNSAAARVSINENVYILEEKSRQIYQDDRPAVAEIPQPQNFKILGFYRGVPIEIRGTLQYSLNEKYDPQVFARGVKACSEWKPRAIR